MRTLIIVLSLAFMASTSIVMGTVQEVKLKSPQQGVRVMTVPGSNQGVRGIGDFNKDGFDDLAIISSSSPAAPFAVVYGGNNLPSNLVLSQIPDGNLSGQGFSIGYFPFPIGPLSTTSSVASGDMNGDGHLDLAVVINQSSGKGAVVLFGQAGGFNQDSPNLQYNPSGSTNAFVSSSVKGFGADFISASLYNFEMMDFNNDTLADLVYTSRHLTPTDHREAYVLFGAPNTAYQNKLLTPDDVGTGGIVSPQVAIVTNSLNSAALGDVNGDGIGDLLSGPFSNSTRLIMRVYYGSSAYGNNATGVTMPSTFDQISFPGVSNIEDGAKYLASVDINGDKLDDIFIGDSGAGWSPDGNIYVVYGKIGGIGTVAIEDLLTTSTKGFVIRGATYKLSSNPLFSGCVFFQVAPAGDMNRDGIKDVAIVAPRSGGGNCINALATVFIIFGQSNGYTGINLNDTNSFNGLAITDCDQAAGCDFTTGGNRGSINALGDINGDGYADIALGYSNGSYILYGGTGGIGGDSTTSGSGGNTASAASSLSEDSIIGILFF